MVFFYCCTRWMKLLSVAIQMLAAEQYFPVVLFIMLFKVVLNFESGWNPKVWPFKWKLLSSTFLCWCLLCCWRCSNFESVDQILKCDHSLNESCWAVLSYCLLCGTRCFFSVTIQMILLWGLPFAFCSCSQSNFSARIWNC